MRESVRLDPVDSDAATGTPPALAVDSVRAIAPASLRARVGGYVVDMVILSAIAMVVLVIAATLLLIATDMAQDRDASNGDMYLFSGTLAAGTAGAWTLLNLALLTMRAQTGGQYVAGLRLARADGTRPAFRDAAVWWFCLNPLLFSWPMAVCAGTALLIMAGLSAAEIVLFVSLFVIVLCIVLPFAALVAAALDARRRALHDRVAGTVVVQA
jgi:uncharacterized RDD family membrane protein YckC